MNVPISPSVDLRNLKDLASVAPVAAPPAVARAENEPSRARRPRRAHPRAPIAALSAGIMAATGVLAWRALVAEADRRAHLRTGLVVAGAGLAALGLGAWQLQRWFTPSPPYEVELRAGHFEVRRYPALQLAVTTVDDRWTFALEDGFRRLARFVFGENVSRQKLGMTTPVLSTGDDDGFKVAFIMPRDRIVPPPTDARVALHDIPSRRLAALRFRGRYSVENLEEHKRELARALARRGLKPADEAMFAGYDPPSTLPFLRRTELWVELA